MPRRCSTTASACKRVFRSLPGRERGEANRLDFPDVIRLVGRSAQEVLDSRGNPTVSVTATTEKGSATARVPPGGSTGKHGALRLLGRARTRVGRTGRVKRIGNGE